MITKTLLVTALLAGVARPVLAQELVVHLVGGREANLATSDLAALADTTFTALDHGRPTTFRGIPLRAILARAGAGSIDSLRGPALRRVLVLRGADGYGAVIALADLDASLGGRSACVVTHENGVPLAPTRGPYRAVLLGDARAARWVRQLVRLELVELP